MHSSMIGKIEKAHRYARQPERVRLQGISATFHGGHDDYVVSLAEGTWNCTCHTYESHAVGDTCSHIMAMQEMLDGMLDDDIRHRQGDATAMAGTGMVTTGRPDPDGTAVQI